MSPYLFIAQHGHGREPALTLSLHMVPPEVPSRPALAPYVELLGAMQGAGVPERQWLLRCHDHFLQLPEFLYHIAACADGAHTLEDIAAEITETTDWLVSAENVRHLLETTLVPLGLIAPGVRTEAVSAAPRLCSEPWTFMPRRVHYV